MLTQKSYIKLPRDFINWRWYTETNVVRVFLHLLLNATFKKVKMKKETLCAGQVITSRRVLAKELKLSEGQIRTVLEKLKSTGDITIKTANKYSIITIEKWAKYKE